MLLKIILGKNDVNNEKKDDKGSKDNKVLVKIVGLNKWNKVIKKVSCNKVVLIYFVI